MRKTNENVGRVTHTHTHTHTHGALKNKKAITLIALVITIIVLIILAGVAINLTLGDSGIFNKARYAKQEYLNADGKEKVQLGEISNNIDSYVENVRDGYKNKYSTEDQIIGEWIDGSPIYRRVITGLSITTGTDKAWKTIASMQDVKNIIDVKLYMDNGTSIYNPLEFSYVSGILKFLVNQNGMNRTLTMCIVEYTKTNNTNSN